jgi:NTP pyrophosphatase (non-canonical NTP hydrolase)
MMTFEDNVIKWASDRNILNGSTPFKQVEKLGEEFTELAVAIGQRDLDKIADSIGDMLVVLTIIASQYDLSIDRCKDFAWNEIKDRKGVMLNGKFVKEV